MRMLSLCLVISRHAQSSFGLLSQGYFEQNPLYLEETTSTVLSVLLLIYGKSKQADVSKFKKEFVDENLKVFAQVFYLYVGSRFLILQLLPSSVNLPPFPSVFKTAKIKCMIFNK